MAGLDDYSLSMQARDAIEKMVVRVIDRERPKYRYGTVTSIDDLETDKKVMVRLTGDPDPIPVQSGNLTVIEVGQRVRVNGLHGDRYIDEGNLLAESPGGCGCTLLTAVSQVMAFEQNNFLLPGPIAGEVGPDFREKYPAWTVQQLEGDVELGGIQNTEITLPAGYYQASINMMFQPGRLEGETLDYPVVASTTIALQIQAGELGGWVDFILSRQDFSSAGEIPGYDGTDPEMFFNIFSAIVPIPVDGKIRVAVRLNHPAVGGSDLGVATMGIIATFIKHCGCEIDLAGEGPGGEDPDDEGVPYWQWVAEDMLGGASGATDEASVEQFVKDMFALQGMPINDWTDIGYANFEAFVADAYSQQYGVTPPPYYVGGPSGPDPDPDPDPEELIFSLVDSISNHNSGGGSFTISPVGSTPQTGDVQAVVLLTRTSMQAIQNPENPSQTIWRGIDGAELVDDQWHNFDYFPLHIQPGDLGDIARMRVYFHRVGYGSSPGNEPLAVRLVGSTLEGSTDPEDLTAPVLAYRFNFRPTNPSATPIVVSADTYTGWGVNPSPASSGSLGSGWVLNSSHDHRGIGIALIGVLTDSGAVESVSSLSNHLLDNMTWFGALQLTYGYYNGSQSANAGGYDEFQGPTGHLVGWSFYLTNPA